jgi:hypothetical protein
VQIFTEQRFAELVENAGLVIEHRQASGFFWVMGMIFFWASERAAGRDLGGAVRDRIQAPYPPLMESWARTGKTAGAARRFGDRRCSTASCPRAR